MAEEEGDDYGSGYYRPSGDAQRVYAYRTRQGLGDLPSGLADERGERFDEGLRGPLPSGPGGPGAVADMARPTDIVETVETQRISPRPPALLYQVISVYDSRPIQAYDFQHSECGSLVFFDDAGAGEFDPVSFTYTVPENTVAVLRTFQYQVSLSPANHVTEGDCWLQSDLFVNDLPVREYHKMFQPVFMRRPFDAFIIVDELLEIRLTLSHTADNELSNEVDGTISPILARFYGNLLLKTGVPSAFEIANAIGGGQL